MANTDFNGKVALVTGGGSGIGEATAKDLAAHNAKVVVADLKLDGAQRVVDEIKQAGGEAAAFEMDASTREGNKAAVDFAVETFGGLHLAVNNAGIGGPGAKVGEMDLDAFDRTVQLDLNGQVYGIHYQIQQFLKQDDPSQTAIVNTSSIHGMVAAMDNVAYTAAKHAMNGVTKNTAFEYGDKGIRVNAVGPAYIDTPLLQQMPEEAGAGLIAKHPLGRLGKPEEIASLIRFLLSDDASFMTGGYYLADGGYTAI